MMSLYFFRLLLLSAASFALIYLAVAFAVSISTRFAIGRAQKMAPSSAARFLLALRLAPGACAIAAIALLGIPSYLRFEPRNGQEEEISAICFLAALAGAALFVSAIVRTLRALVVSARFARIQGVASRVGRQQVWIVESSVPCIALTGIFRPRLFVSEAVVRTLSGDQLAATLRHEDAHRISRDNLKRLLIKLVPGVFPRFQMLEHEWMKFSEWAADDFAVAGDPRNSVSLAEALVRVRRIGTPFAYPSIATSLLESGDDLPARVDRLLCATSVIEDPRRSKSILLFCSVAVLGALIALPSLEIVHRVMETLID